MKKAKAKKQNPPFSQFQVWSAQTCTAAIEHAGSAEDAAEMADRLRALLQDIQAAKKMYDVIQIHAFFSLWSAGLPPYVAAPVIIAVLRWEKAAQVRVNEKVKAKKGKANVDYQKPQI